MGRIFEVGELSGKSRDSLLIQLDSISFPTRGTASLHLADVTSTHYDVVNSKIQSTFLQENVRSRVSWVEVTDKNHADTVRTYFSYDIHGNVKSLLQQIPGLQPKRTDYVYDLVSGKVNYVMYQYGKSDQFMHRYRYDADNRITSVETSSDGFIWDKDAAYQYYLHGPLARTELGEYRVQGLDYYYTLQGWIKGVNMPSSGDPGADGTDNSVVGKDVFAYTLGYFDGDFTPINNSVTLSESRDKLWTRSLENIQHNGLYNGNISWMTTDLRKIGQAKGDANKSMQAMMYRYDQQHRITKSRSLTNYNPVTGFAVRGTHSAYDEDYSYDANGNILTLNRNDETSALKDEFNYTYYDSTNRLKQHKVNGGQYHYDAIGNLVNDQGEGTVISWTPYGKVRTVIKGDSVTVNYRYDATGNRIEKSVLNAGKAVVTNYLRDASGNVMAIYNDSTMTEEPIYGSTRVGQYSGGRMEGYRTLGERKYELSNHLGNVLTVITDNVGMKTDSVWATVASASDYYPFGLEMKGREFSDTTYRYGFNGKEKDNFFNTTVYDYGARIYDPNLVRFKTLDPLFSKFPAEGNYSYAGNSPIQFIDEEGKKKIYYITRIAQDGSITKLVVVNKYEVKQFVTYPQEYISIGGQTLFTGTGKVTKTYDIVQNFTIDEQKGTIATDGEQLGEERSNDVAQRFLQDNFDQFTTTLAKWDDVLSGGIVFTYGAGQGQEDRSGKNRDSKAENIDLLVNVITTANAAAGKKAKTFVEEFKEGVDAINVSKDEKKLLIDKIGSGDNKNVEVKKPKSVYCGSCKKMVPAEETGHILDPTK